MILTAFAPSCAFTLSHRNEVARVTDSRCEAEVILPPLGSSSYVEVLEYVFPFAAGKKSATPATGDIAIYSFGTGFCLNYSVNCLASRAIQ
jgi:hypothetical protein